jgi:glycerate 2-kinase
LKRDALDIFAEACDAVSLDRVMLEQIRVRDGSLHLRDISINLASFDRITLVAIGKAATPMTEAILLALDGIPHIDGIAVGATQPAQPDPRIHWMQGSHPLPDQRSLDAADAILALLATCSERTLVLLLLSGGASSMIEKPLSPAMDLDDVITLNRALVHSGLPIAEMNTLRKHFSAVKGGRLAAAAGAATLVTLIVSDTPSGEVEIVGSGPSLPDPTTAAECRALAASVALPPKLRAYFEDPELPETPKPGDDTFARTRYVLLLSSDDLCVAAAATAEAHGFHSVVDNTCDEWDYREAARHLLHRAQTLHADYPQLCLLSAGEISVPLAEPHGVGGRNQHFVLESLRLAGELGLNITILSAGSDGIDGNSPAAGAVGDTDTSVRAQALGFDVESSLAAFDSYPLFEALDDAIVTGPLGNNLRDLRIFLVEASTRS